MTPASFEPTRWSIVLGAGASDPAVRRAALEKLCAQYWYPLYAFLRRKGRDPERAADLVQGLFTQLLERDSFAKLERKGGRFRSWLLTALIHHESHQLEHGRALKRGGGRAPIPIDPEDGEHRLQLAGPTDEDPERAFERAWAEEVLHQARLLLEQELGRDGKARHYEVLGPALTPGGGERPLAELARELGMSSVALRVALHRLRSRYRELLIQVVGDSIGERREAGEELGTLAEALRSDSGVSP